jgi:hypothetical protein
MRTRYIFETAGLGAVAGASLGATGLGGTGASLTAAAVASLDIVWPRLLAKCSARSTAIRRRV